MLCCAGGIQRRGLTSSGVGICCGCFARLRRSGDERFRYDDSCVCLCPAFGRSFGGLSGESIRKASFSSHVRWGERGAPVMAFAPPRLPKSAYWVQNTQVDSCGIPHPRFPVKVSDFREPHAPFLRATCRKFGASREKRARYGAPLDLLLVKFPINFLVGSGCEPPRRGPRLSIALPCVSARSHHKAKKACWVKASSRMRHLLAETVR
jgi:hypothetical protein